MLSFVENECILSLCYLGQVSFDVLTQEPERRMYQWSLMRQEQPDGKYVWPYQADMEEIPQRQGEQPRPVSGSATFMHFCHKREFLPSSCIPPTMMSSPYLRSAECLVMYQVPLPEKVDGTGCKREPKC